MAIHSKHARPRALITGLRGFTGEYLARELESCGYEIFGTAFGNERLGKNITYLDLCDFNAVQNLVREIEPDVVAHLAAISFVPHADLGAMYRINVDGTENLLRGLASLAYPPRSVLLASSANIYGNVEVESLSETQCAQPSNDYAKSKLAMETLAHGWMDQLPLFITRPFNYTGVGQSDNFLIPKIIAHARRFAPTIELGNLDVARDFSDVRTVVKAYSALLRKAPRGQTFNICSGHAHTLREVITMVEEISSHMMQVRVNPAFVRPNEIHILKGDPSKLQHSIGTLPQIPLRETLAWMLGMQAAVTDSRVLQKTLRAQELAEVIG